jgi:hypothetical protein
MDLFGKMICFEKPKPFLGLLSRSQAVVFLFHSRSPPRPKPILPCLASLGARWPTLLPLIPIHNPHPVPGPLCHAWLTMSRMACSHHIGSIPNEECGLTLAWTKGIVVHRGSAMACPVHLSKDLGAATSTSNCHRDGF